MKIAFEDNPLRAKNRPIIIINHLHENNTYLIAEITKSKPKTPPTYHDQFKVPIKKWKQAGLNKKSYVKAHKIHLIQSTELLKKIGKMDLLDLANVTKRVIEANNF